MTLAQIQAELRPISGSPYQSEEDRLRRMDLWKRLDTLAR